MSIFYLPSQVFPHSLSIEPEVTFCYTDWIHKNQTHTMSIEACIAHAIHNDLDILEVLPEVHDIPVEELELYIERFIIQVQSDLCEVIIQHGDE